MSDLQLAAVIIQEDKHYYLNLTKSQKNYTMTENQPLRIFKDTK